MASIAAEPRTFTFHHDQLGVCPMTGLITPDDVVQFRAIPYATIPARFKQSIVNTDLGGKQDFTKHGHACPQTFPPSTTSGGPTPGDPTPFTSSEFSCLILQINVPLSALTAPVPTPNLPVLVYVHGGGFVLGRIDEQHSTALLVSQSLSTQPILSASIQYRLGALGYLCVPEVGSENIALYDQRNALIWLQKFVGGFGGDKSQVTVFGESGGAMAICCQMLFRVYEEGRLFRRVVFMSGVLGPGTAPGTKGEAGEVYEGFLKKVGIEQRGEEGLERLREVDVERIVEATDEFAREGGMWRTTLTEEWFGMEGSWDKIPERIGECEWVDEIVLGTTGFEGTTFMARVADITPQAFIAGLSETFGEENAKELSQAYNVQPDMDQNLFITSALRWIGDVIFEAPTHTWAAYLSTHTSKKLYRYVFTVRNPFPANPLYQQSHHWVDKYFVFKTLQFRYPSQRLKDISTQHAQLWIDIAHGKEPWSEYTYTGNGDEVIMVADEREGWQEKTVKQHEEIVEWSWERCERLVKTWKGSEGRTFDAADIEPLRGKSLV